MATCHIHAEDPYLFCDMLGGMPTLPIIQAPCLDFLGMEEDPEVVISFTAPYRIQHANAGWLDMMGLR
jgi:hypothetical protein